MIGTKAGELADKLLICLCDALNASVGGAVCQCSIRPGSAPPPADACCACTTGQGQASVQVGPIFPTSLSRFPSRFSGPINNCSDFEWAAELTMTVYRCVSVADEEGFPSEDELTADALKIAGDADAMWRALFCCGWRVVPNDDELIRIVPGDWRPIDPAGGCSGGQMTVTAYLGSICCPLPE